MDSPVSMSQRAKSPMCTSPFTVHFCVSQFGLQLWFINRDRFPFCPASMTRSCGAKSSTDRLKETGRGFSPLSGDLVLPNYLREGEHVEVGHVVFMGAFDSLLALFCVDHLTHILRHKLPLKDTNTHISCSFRHHKCNFLQGVLHNPPPHTGYLSTAQFFQPSLGAGLPWGPNRGRLSWSLLSLHTVV